VINEAMILNKIYSLIQIITTKILIIMEFKIIIESNQPIDKKYLKI